MFSHLKCEYLYFGVGKLFFRTLYIPIKVSRDGTMVQWYELQLFTIQIKLVLVLRKSFPILYRKYFVKFIYVK